MAVKSTWSPASSSPLMAIFKASVALRANDPARIGDIENGPGFPWPGKQAIRFQGAGMARAPQVAQLPRQHLSAAP